MIIRALCPGREFWQIFLLCVFVSSGSDFALCCQLQLRNEANFSWGAVHTTPKKFENAALFLRLGLPSTLTRHENGAFQKRSSNGGIWVRGFAF